MLGDGVVKGKGELGWAMFWEGKVVELVIGYGAIKGGGKPEEIHVYGG